LTDHDDAVYLAHIAEMIRRIQTSLQMGRSRLESDLDVQDAVLRRLQTLAESTQRLSQEVKDRHAEIPWKRIAGFRNVATHGYLSIDLDLVWASVMQLPELGKVIDEEQRRLDRSIPPS
jgi:uncharacterized protein with HEPN domain